MALFVTTQVAQHREWADAVGPHVAERYRRITRTDRHLQ